MKKKTNVTKIWFLILFLLVATYLVITVYQIVSYQNGTKTEAVVSKVHHQRIKSGSRHQTSSKSTKVIIKYYANDTEFEKSIKLSGWKHIKKGDKIKVSYNPDKNEKVYVKKVIFEDIRFTILLIGFTVLQIVIVRRFKNSEKSEKGEHLNE